MADIQALYREFLIEHKRRHYAQQAKEIEQIMFNVFKMPQEEASLKQWELEEEDVYERAANRAARRANLDADC